MKTHWKRKALTKYKSIIFWYKKNLGVSAARKFMQGINDVVAVLEQNPYMGKEEPELKACKKITVPLLSTAITRLSIM